MDITIIHEQYSWALKCMDISVPLLRTFLNFVSVDAEKKDILYINKSNLQKVALQPSTPISFLLPQNWML
jgi:hypothetical protein